MFTALAMLLLLVAAGLVMSGCEGGEPGMKFVVTVKPPPTSRSFPSLPESTSVPPEPPVRMLSRLLPVIVSLPLVPPIFSMLRSVSVSPSWFTMTSVFVSFRVTFTPVALVKITVSLPPNTTRSQPKHSMACSTNGRMASAVTRCGSQ